MLKYLKLVCCRRAEKQRAFITDPDEESDVGLDNLHMDDLMTETQEPEPGLDLDEEQRPRLSRVSSILNPDPYYRSPFSS